MSTRSRKLAGPEPSRVLVLGGTREAYDLACALAERARSTVAVTSSLAGRTSSPLVPPGDVRIGGFGGVAGLTAYLQREGIAAVVDATHPFAARISANAVLACACAGVHLIAFERPRWASVPGDRWERVADVPAAAQRASELGTRIFLTIGRQELAPFANVRDRWFLIRAIEPPEQPLPPHHTLVLARGPFAAADEYAILQAHAIDVVVAKDSGGDATGAKLAAARTRGIPVVLVERPRRSDVRTVDGIDAAIAWLAELPSPVTGR
ncbi:MAG: cobalt-precorrin-6A reductase [Vulcanimicrobiaceae bacterium]